MIKASKNKNRQYIPLIRNSNAGSISEYRRFPYEWLVFVSHQFVPAFLKLVLRVKFSNFQGFFFFLKYILRIYDVSGYAKSKHLRLLNFHNVNGSTLWVSITVWGIIDHWTHFTDKKTEAYGGRAWIQTQIFQSP